MPAGVTDGQRIHVQGRGAPGANGGPAGDLYVVVHVGAHPIFGRSGTKHLTVTLPITFAEAALGAAGEGADARRPGHGQGPGRHPARQDGPKVTGRGIAPAKGEPGDLLVTFDVEVPKHLTDEQRQAVETLQRCVRREPPLAPRRLTRCAG